MATAGADAIIPLANRLQALFPLVVATKDWHPSNHSSFASNHPGHQVGESMQMNGLMQVLWPDHCVQESSGAEFHDALDTQKISKTFYKGTDVLIDSYSAFYDNAHQRQTGLQDYLQAQGITDVYILGLVTDYCVKFSALDAKQAGFKVYVIEDACCAYEAEPGDSLRALDEMRAAGIQIISSAAISRLSIS